MTNHLYIHIPFCESKCPYCAFESGTHKNINHIDYLNAIIKTLKTKQYETVYFGGGTPSVINANLYKDIFSKIEGTREITIEANPSSASYEWLNTMYNYGANRVSFGMQSVREDKLKLLGRAHNKEQAFNAVINAAKVGFKRISVDFMYDTILDTPTSIQAELDEILKLPIDHISLYGLTLEENTPFYKTPSVQKQNDENSFIISETLLNAGFEHYEVASFGKTKSAHNIAYWSGSNYDGVGYGAFGYDGKKRYKSSARNLTEYIINPDAIDYEEISDSERRLELIFLGLRSIVGVFESILTDNEKKQAMILFSEKKLEYLNGVFYNKNFWLSDEIALFISSR